MTNMFRLNGRNSISDNELTVETLPILTVKNFIDFKKFRNKGQKTDTNLSNIPINKNYSNIIESEKAIPYTYQR